MGRLIDADAFKEALGTDTKIRRMFCMVIDEQPTAYDVEKVVAELEALKTKYRKLQAVSDDHLEINELYTRCIQIDKDIEIVKRGGVE
jgi:cytochrome c556